MRTLPELLAELVKLHDDLESQVMDATHLGEDEAVAVHHAAIRVDNARYLIASVLSGELRPCTRCGHARSYHRQFVRGPLGRCARTEQSELCTCRHFEEPS